MKSINVLFTVFLAGAISLNACAQAQKAEVFKSEFPQVIANSDDYNELTDEERHVILEKGTEWAFSGQFHNYKQEGTYICKQCNQPLFRSSDKFNSSTGWPSFDDLVPGAVSELTDADGRRSEIVCSNCGGHLGHVFLNEGFTTKQTRHCVNSLSLDFVTKDLE